MILSGSAHPKLASDLAKKLNTSFAKVEISMFPNGEKRLRVKENLTNKTVIIVQPFSQPVDEHIIEFCLLQDAAYHLKAKKIIGVIPWFGYSPQDKLFRSGEPISAHVVARLIASSQLDKIFLVDIHSQSSLKHFNVPVTHLSALDLFVDYFKKSKLQNHLAVALDKGSHQRTVEFAQKLNIPFIKLKKTRDKSTGKVSFADIRHKIRGKNIISYDDFISTGSTQIKANDLLKKNKAKSYISCVTHCLMAKGAAAKLKNSSIDQIITTDSYPITKNKRFSKLKILSLSSLIAKALVGEL